MEGLGVIVLNFLNIDEVNFGLVMEILVVGGFSFQLELVYMIKGFGLKEGFDVELLGVNLLVSVCVEIWVCYVEMLLLVKYKFGEEVL